MVLIVVTFFTKKMTLVFNLLLVSSHHKPMMPLRISLNCRRDVIDCSEENGSLPVAVKPNRDDEFHCPHNRRGIPMHPEHDLHYT